jgi:DNA-binding protein HU-beta
LGSFVSAITTSLSAGEKVTLPGFGTFSVGERAPREGRNPKTGERINIQASKVVKFRAGKSVRERVK